MVHLSVPLTLKRSLKNNNSHLLGKRKNIFPFIPLGCSLIPKNLDSPESQKCLKCKNNLPLISFPWSHQKEGHTLMCIKCTASKEEWRQKQKLAKESNKENIDLQGSILCVHDKKLTWCIPTCWVNCVHLHLPHSCHIRSLTA